MIPTTDTFVRAMREYGYRHPVVFRQDRWSRDLIIRTPFGEVRLRPNFCGDRYAEGVRMLVDALTPWWKFCAGMKTLAGLLDFFPFNEEVVL